MNDGLLGFPRAEGAVAAGKMRGWPGKSVQQQHASATNAAISSSGSNFVKGAWTELVAATEFEVMNMMVTFDVTAANLNCLYDIGVGQPGNERIVIPNLLCSTLPNGEAFMHCLSFRCRIPRGERIVARMSASTATATGQVHVLLSRVGWQDEALPTWRVEAVGSDQGASRGTSIDPGATINVKGSWTHLPCEDGENPFRHWSGFRYRSISVAFGNQLNIANTNMDMSYDIGVGELGREEILIPDITISQQDLTDFITPTMHGPFSVDVPAGTRFAARSATTNNNATDRLKDIVVYGNSL